MPRFHQGRRTPTHWGIFSNRSWFDGILINVKLSNQMPNFGFIFLLLCSHSLVPKKCFSFAQKTQLTFEFWNNLLLITFLYHHHFHHHLTIITYKSKSMSMVTQDEPTSPPPPAAPSSQLTGRRRGYRRRAASDAFALATGASHQPLSVLVRIPIESG